MASSRLLRSALLLSAAMTCSLAAAASPRLVASTPPIHSLVAGVSGDRAEPHLLVPGGRSPHNFALAPSDARALAHADAVFTAGGSADDFLQRPLATLAGDARVVPMATVADVRRLPARAGGTWGTHEHEGERSPREHEHEHEHDHKEDTGAAFDPHLWLDPRNAIAYTRAIADALAAIDPDHAQDYWANAADQVERLRALDARLQKRLAPLADRPFLVFHDAYQYLEARYGLAAAGSIAINPDRPPGARRLGELRERIAQRGIECLFTEPQFEPRIADVIAEGSEVRVATLDPLGAGLEPGARLYDALLSGLATSLERCLAAQAGA